MQRLKKVLKAIAIVIFLVVISMPLYLSYWRNANTIATFSDFYEPKNISFGEMYWKDGNIGSVKIPKTALFIKVFVNDINKPFYMQFDTGTPTTVFYGKTLATLQKKYKTLIPSYDVDSMPFVKNVTLSITKTVLTANKIAVLPKMGNSVIDTTFTIIGTIGFDSFVDRTLILNFKNNKIAITNQSIQEISPHPNIIKDASVNKFPLLIPAKLDSKKIRFFYDSGSSLFTILTSTNNLTQLKSSSKIDTLCCIQNWDKQLPVYRKKINSLVSIGTIDKTSNYVYSIEKMDIADYFPKWFLYGITGNKFFENQIVIIDNKHNLLSINN